MTNARSPDLQRSFIPYSKLQYFGIASARRRETQKQRFSHINLLRPGYWLDNLGLLANVIGRVLFWS
jgi:hypothetical protein